MFDPTTYRPNPLVVAGGAWARRKGLRNCDFYTDRVTVDGTVHLHVVNAMFDHRSLMAVVMPGAPGYQARVIPCGTCSVCTPLAPVSPECDTCTS